MTCDLQKNLEKLGAKDIFTGNSGITGIVKDPLYISAAVQRTKIKVDEEGTKAAAITEFVAKCTAVAVPKVPPHYDSMVAKFGGQALQEREPEGSFIFFSDQAS